MRMLLIAVLRIAQFAAGFLLAYAATYGLQLSNQALLTTIGFVVAVSLAASALEHRPLAGAWASVLGATGLFLLAIPRLTWPECPATGSCVSPGTHATTVIAIVVAVLAIAWGARSAQPSRSAPDRGR